jgi:TRAP-type C4-dicarboxylate transport system substrate-binding protein
MRQPPEMRSNWNLLVPLLLLGIAGCDRSVGHVDGPAVWRFAIEESEGSVQHAYAIEFEKRIEAKMNGRVDVVVYPYGTLGTSTQITEQLNLGILQFAMASPGSLGKFIPEMQVFLLHFILTDDDLANRELLANTDLLNRCDALYAQKGLKLLSIFTEGQMVWTTQREVRTPEDFRGVKMRVMTSPILLDAYNSYGANATPMPYAEVYSALQLNMIDGQVNPVFAIERQKFYEVTNWMIFPGHAHFVTSAAANRPFFDSLDDRDQAIITGVIDELRPHIDEVQRAYETERLKRIIRDRRDKRQVLNVVGDMQAFCESLNSEELQELVTDNPYLNLAPPLTESELERFRERSVQVQQTFLRVGGQQASALLDQLLGGTRP